MAPKRPRFSVGVMAMCCGFLSLTVVAREATSVGPGGADAPRKYAPVHQPEMHPGASSPLGGSQTPATTPLSPVPSQGVESKRHRQTRETLPVPRPATGTEEEFGAPERAIRRRRMDPRLGSLASAGLVFVPARGRRYGAGGGFGVPTEKRQITIEQMLEKGDYFVPNRGKKAPAASGGGGGGGVGGDLMIKKGKFDVLLGPGSPDEYFFPNRGKKEYFLAYDPTGSGRFAGKLAASGGFGGHPLESRLRRNLLENLANEHKDTFFSSRGKRIRPADEPREQLVPDDGGARSEDASGQQTDIEATLLWDDALPVLPLERPSS